jgi:shikimate kinase
VIIEFMGLPGAGKSTLHRRAALGFQDMGLRVVDGRYLNSQIIGLSRPRARRIRRILYYLPVVRFYHRTFWLVVGHLVKSRRTLRDKTHAFRWMLASARRYMMAVGEGEAMVLLDEGPMQRAFTFFVDHGGQVHAQAARSYMKMVPLPDVLVFAKVDPEVTLQRLSQRPRWLPKRFTDASPEQLLRVMSDGQAMFEGMLEEARGRNPEIVTIVVDTNELDTAWKELEEQLVDLVSQKCR